MSDKVYGGHDESTLLSEALINIKDVVTLLEKYLKVKTDMHKRKVVLDEAEEEKKTEKFMKKINKFEIKRKKLEGMGYILKKYEKDESRFKILRRVKKSDGTRVLRLKGFLLTSGILHAMVNKELVRCKTTKDFQEMVKGQNA